MRQLDTDPIRLDPPPAFPFGLASRCGGGV